MNLELEGYQVFEATDGQAALDEVRRRLPDLVVMDVMMPEMDGFEALRELRRFSQVPVVLLTVKADERDVIHGLELGADDYIGKPFSIAELVLRVKAVLRRSRTGVALATEIRLAGDIAIDTRNLSGSRAGELLQFTRREIDILQYLQQNSDRPVSREELLTRVWGYDRTADLETRTVDIHIAKLRRKIEPDAKEPRNLITVRGAGYRLLVGV